jgi:putative transcriptional regulator
MATMATRIRELRLACGLTQEQLAHRMGLTEKTLRNWERGTHAPRLEAVVTLADALDVTLDELVGRTKPAKKKRGRIK